MAAAPEKLLPRRPARLLRGRRPRRPDRRARARAVRRRRSTCARRSSTTSTWSSSCASAARSSSRRRPRCPRARPSSSPPTASRRRCTRTPSARELHDDRRHLPARDQGPRARRSKFAAEGYTIVLIGHEGHEEVEGTMGEAPDAHRPRRDRGGRRRRSRSPIPTASPTSPRRRCRSTRPTAIIRRLRERFPNITGPQHRRHLLRDDQPPGGGQADGRASATSCS